MTLCALCLQRIMRLDSGALCLVDARVNYGEGALPLPARGGIACPTVTGEIEGHRLPFATTV